MEIIYDKKVQYLRKGKWRICQLQIEIVRRCQDKLVAVIRESNDSSSKFPLYGYECNNGYVSLIGSSDILRIKFDSLELVPQFKVFLGKYIKDVSFKIQLQACTPSQSVMQVDEWYTMHVQTNRICFTTDSGNRLVTKWDRSNIGYVDVEYSYLNIEIIYKKGEKYLYSFFRDDKFPLRKIFKAIQNLKFELPLPKSDKMPSTPRRSGSMDLRKQYMFGNIRDRITRPRTYSSSVFDDAISNDDSSPPSTPVSPLCIFGTNEPTTNHIDEIDEEADLMFPIDSPNSQTVSLSYLPKTNGYLNNSSNVNIYGDNTLTDLVSLDARRKLSYDSSNTKLVDLERYPFESDLRNQGKPSPELITHSPTQPTYNYQPNIHENLKKSSYYHTMDSLKHRKTFSDTNFGQHQKMVDTNGNISHSADLNSNLHDNFLITSEDSVSNNSSPLRPLSSGNVSSDTQGITSEEVYADHSRQSDSPRQSEYYNLQASIDIGSNQSCRNQISLTDNNPYYNLSNHLQSGDNYRNLDIEMAPSSQVTISMPSMVESTMSYVQLDFPDHFSCPMPKKSASQINYTEIGIHETQVLKDLDNTLRINTSKKKKSSFLNFFSKK